MIPPVGRKAIKACWRVYESIEEELANEVELCSVSSKHKGCGHVEALGPNAQGAGM